MPTRLIADIKEPLSGRLQKKKANKPIEHSPFSSKFIKIDDDFAKQVEASRITKDFRTMSIYHNGKKNVIPSDRVQFFQKSSSPHVNKKPFTLKPIEYNCHARSISNVAVHTTAAKAPKHLVFK
jgi:hypothetical protein